MYVYGKNVAEEIKKKGEKVKKAFIVNNFSDKYLISALEKRNISIKYLSKFEIDKLANGNHQGIILDIPDYEYCDESEFINDENALVVILDHLEDPHNLGAIIRTCEAAGVTGIIIPKNRSVSVNSTIKYLKDNGFWIVGTDMNGTSYDEIDYSGKIAIVIGNEGSGMSKLVEENCDFIASIPMRGVINSLNASVAAGIVIYEAIKSRK